MQLVGENSANVLNNKEPFNDEILNTFTAELAHIAYFGVSRHISKYRKKKLSEAEAKILFFITNLSNYVDSILNNGDIIHQLCHEYERSKNKDLTSQSKTKTLIKTNKKSIILFSIILNNHFKNIFFFRSN